MVVPAVNTERFEIRHRPGLGRKRFRGLIWKDIILSLLNKICVNSSAIGRLGGGIIDD